MGKIAHLTLWSLEMFGDYKPYIIRLNLRANYSSEFPLPK